MERHPLPDLIVKLKPGQNFTVHIEYGNCSTQYRLTAGKVTWKEGSDFKIHIPLHQDTLV